MAYDPYDMRLDSLLAPLDNPVPAPPAQGQGLDSSLQLAAAAPPDAMDEYAKSLVPGAGLVQKFKEYFGLAEPEKPKEKAPQWGGTAMAIPGRPGHIRLPDGRIIGPDGKVTK